MSSLILWFPILSALSTGLLGRYLGVTGSQFTAVILILACLITLIISIIEYLLSGTSITWLLPFVHSGIIHADWGLLIDSLSLSLLLPVVLISFCVHLYSVNYMGHDPHSQRFISYLSLFTASMILLVISPSLLQLFVGWELIGLSSYLLIGFWYTRLPASQSALQAFIINRLGDVALSIALYITLATYSTLNFSSILPLATESQTYNLLTITILIAAMAKSAQFPIQTWLPSAMEGPTPVSALIHAATLVTAGAYLLLRISFLLDQSSDILLITGLIGSLTALFAGTVGMVQNDLKRIIAFSTCSQIGYLFIAIGAGQYNIALFHIVNHAIFKALLFLGAGVIIHAIQDNQDIRRIGGFLSIIPLAYISLLIGSLSLIALPFLTGFYSKELIIELNYVQFTILPSAMYLLATIGAALTGFYSTRLLYLTFYGRAHASPSTYSHFHSPDYIIALPLVILLLLSVILGYYFKDAYSGLGSPLLANTLAMDNHLNEVEFFISPIIKIIPLFLTLFASILALLYPYSVNNQSTAYTYAIYRFLSIKWGLDHVINYLGFTIINAGLAISKVIDRGFIEIIGPYGISSLLYSTTLIITGIRPYHITRYSIAIVLTLLLSLLAPTTFDFAPLILSITLFIIPLLILQLI